MQIELPFFRPDVAIWPVERIWLAASEDEWLISPRHRQFFLNAETGTQSISSRDLVVLRKTSGAYSLIVGDDLRIGRDDAPRMISWLEAQLERAMEGAFAKDDERELIVFSFRASKRGGARDAAPKPRGSTRTSLEETLQNVASQRRLQNGTTTLQVLQKKLQPGVHPIIGSLLTRDYADALAEAYYTTDLVQYADAAFAEYRAADASFQRLSLSYQSTKTRANAERLRRRSAYPSFLMAADRADGRTKTLGFSFHRVVGFPINIGMGTQPRSGQPDDKLVGATLLGEIDINNALMGRLLVDVGIYTRRLAAYVTCWTDRVVVRAGVFAELHALLKLELQYASQADIRAIHIVADSIDFGHRTWVINPQDPAVFCGRMTRRRYHWITVRASTNSGGNLELRFRFDSTLKVPQRFV